MKKTILIILLIIGVLVNQHSQEIKKVKDNSELKNIFEKIINDQNDENNYWIGYSIKNSNKSEMSFGSLIFGDETKNYPSLYDIIYKNVRVPDYDLRRKSSYSCVKISGGHVYKNRPRSEETAILFKYNKKSKDIKDFETLTVTGINNCVILNNSDIYWLDKKDSDESFNFLKNLFEKSDKLAEKKALLNAIGIHCDYKETFNFLKEVLYSYNGNKELKKESVFLIGIQDNANAFYELKNIISNDNLSKFHASALFSIAQTENKEVVDFLAKIANNSENKELRKNAIFALAQKAASNVDEILKDIIENDKDVELKKTALYALSNEDNQIPYLIKVAKTNNSKEVRKAAIYALGNSGDERAQEALIDIALQK